MIRQNLDRQWNFRSADTSLNWWLKAESVIVDLPHDFSIIQERDPHSQASFYNGFFPGGTAVYEKNLYIPEEWRGRRILLEFEGVYMNAAVRFNDQLIAHHPYGYTSFHCDLTPYLLYGRDNILRVTVNNSAVPNTRWYSGSAVYRHVWLLIGESVHIPAWGVYSTTPEVSPERSVIFVKTTVENYGLTLAGITVRTTLLTACGNEAASGETRLEINAGNKSEAAQTLMVAPALLWSVENPYLYTLRSEILMNDTVIDTTETVIGIRSISFDAQGGFRLNDIPMKLKGGCVHHDCGLLGSAAFDRAEERKVELLKASGFNAVRCAHNPPSPAFLNACDRLGMLVIDEAFDCWREPKNNNDYSNYFEDWWERDMASMVLRDRNHPCVILWSTGNEILERDGRSEGYVYARRLADFVRSMDDTRSITNGLCNFELASLVTSISAKISEIPEDYDHWGELTAGFVEPLDIVGYNYLLNRYESDGKKFPKRIICGTETFPKDAYDYWEAVERFPYVIGDFVWTALDYLGEAGIGYNFKNENRDYPDIFPWHQAYCGDIDICGFKRPQSYYRDCLWGVSKAPYIAVHKPENYGKNHHLSEWGWPDVLSSWTWPGNEGRPAVIDLYCSDSEVELFINGRSLGRKYVGKANRYTASFESVYEPGEVVAVGYENGFESSRSVLKTAGLPASIRLTPDRSRIMAQFGDLSYITVEVLDAEGNVVHNSVNEIHFELQGAGSLQAVGRGNPATEEMYTGNRRRVHEGRAMAVVRAGGEAGEIVLTAASEGIKAASITICVEQNV